MGNILEHVGVVDADHKIGFVQRVKGGQWEAWVRTGGVSYRRVLGAWATAEMAEVHVREARAAGYGRTAEKIQTGLTRAPGVKP